MEHPVQIRFRGFEPTDAIKRDVEERAEKLETFYDKIESCRIIVEAPHRHHRKGNLYHVGIRVTVPGEVLVVSRDPKEHAEHEDVHVAINDAFKDVTRRLQDYVRRRRREVKQHVGPPQARVARIFHEKGYGFLETDDAREIYFHKNSVIDNAFDHLEVGTVVRFAEEQGDKGPQASTVTIVGGGGK